MPEAQSPPMRLLVREPQRTAVLTFCDGAMKSPTQLWELRGDARSAEAAVCATGTLWAVPLADAVHVVALSPNGGTAVVRVVPTPTAVESLVLSPKGTLLRWFASPTRSAAGGAPPVTMAIIDTATGAQKVTGTARSPLELHWTPDEAYCITLAVGRMILHEGTFARGDEPLATLEVPLDQQRMESAAVAVTTTTARAGSTSVGHHVALFTPLYKQRQAAVAIYTLPNLKQPALSATYGRATAASLSWNCSGTALTVVTRFEGGGDYYGRSALNLVTLEEGKSMEVTVQGPIHDARWSPVDPNALLVVHAAMPQNETTLFSAGGVPLMTFGVAPRNTAMWAPNGRMVALGGSSNLAGDYVFYSMPALHGGAGKGRGTNASQTPKEVGRINDKSSSQGWSPDGRYFLAGTTFDKLRVDNKFALWKHNGEKAYEQRFPSSLLQVTWMPPVGGEAFAARPPSPIRTVSEGSTAPKPTAYRPPSGGISAAAALLRRPTADVAPVRPAGPVGAVVEESGKKKKKR